MSLLKDSDIQNGSKRLQEKYQQKKGELKKGSREDREKRRENKNRKNEVMVVRDRKKSISK